MRHYLLVDDNRAFAENLSDIVADNGATATVAASGAEALELVARVRFDAMLSDMRMPGMGGAELVRRIRAIDPGLPAIVATAYTSDDELTAVRAAGILAVLPKPVPIVALLALLTRARRDALVALVEDDIALADNIAEALRDHGFSTVTATSASEADHVFAVRPFAALVDLRLPGAPDGSAIAILTQKYPKLPIIAMTAFADIPKPLSSRACLSKPFSMQTLLDVVQRQHDGHGE